MTEWHVGFRHYITNEKASFRCVYVRACIPCLCLYIMHMCACVLCSVCGALFTLCASHEHRTANCFSISIGGTGKRVCARSFEHFTPRPRHRAASLELHIQCKSMAPAATEATGWCSGINTHVVNANVTHYYFSPARYQCVRICAASVGCRHGF